MRSVQFFVNDELIATDGNFPFGVRFFTPTGSDGSDRFSLRAVFFPAPGSFEMRAIERAERRTESRNNSGWGSNLRVF